MHFMQVSTILEYERLMLYMFGALWEAPREHLTGNLANLRRHSWYFVSYCSVRPFYTLCTNEAVLAWNRCFPDRWMYYITNLVLGSSIQATFFSACYSCLFVNAAVCRMMVLIRFVPSQNRKQPELCNDFEYGTKLTSETRPYSI